MCHRIDAVKYARRSKYGGAVTVRERGVRFEFTALTGKPTTYCNDASSAEVERVVLVDKDDVVAAGGVRVVLGVGDGGRDDCGKDIHVYESVLTLNARCVGVGTSGVRTRGKVIKGVNDY